MTPINNGGIVYVEIFPGDIQMKKTGFFFVTLILMCGFSLQADARVIATWPRKAMFIEKMVYSPDGTKVALQARDRAGYYKRIATIWVGSARYGRFKKLSSDSVAEITWIDNHSIAFLDKSALGSFGSRKKPAIVVKAIDVKTRHVEMIYRLPAEAIRGSGGRTGTLNFYGISPGARLLLVKTGKNYILEDLKARRPVYLRNFTIPYSSNPQPQFRFFGRNRAILFDGRNRRYKIYRYDGRGLRLEKTISSLGGHRPSGDFSIDKGGKSILFASEVCRGGCRNEIYRYDLQRNRLSRKLMTVRGSQVLRIVFSPGQNELLVNDFHRWLKTYRLPRLRR